MVLEKLRRRKKIDKVQQESDQILLESGRIMLEQSRQERLFDKEAFDLEKKRNPRDYTR